MTPATTAKKTAKMSDFTPRMIVVGCVPFLGTQARLPLYDAHGDSVATLGRSGGSRDAIDSMWEGSQGLAPEDDRR